MCLVASSRALAVVLVVFQCASPAAAQQACPRGEAGNPSVGAGCEPCGSGKEQSAPYPAGTTVCLDCPAGTYRPLEETFGPTCKPCDDGNKPNAARDGCVPCGLTEAGRHGICAPCEDGVRPLAGGAICSPCPTAQATDARFSSGGRNGGPGRCVACPTGKQPNELKTLCIDCPEGKAGTYGQCQDCPHGERATSDHVRCQSCDPADAGIVLNCPCEHGFQASAQGCEPCAGNSAGADGDCTPCGTGRQPNSDRTACEACPAGQATETADGSCTLCRDGFTPETTNRNSCQPCRAGWAGKEGICEPCTAGQYPSMGHTICSTCQESWATVCTFPSSRLVKCDGLSHSAFVCYAVL